MNPLAVKGIVVTTASIAALVAITVSQHKKIQRLQKHNQRLTNFSLLCQRIVIAQMENIDGDSVVIPESLVIDMEAFSIFSQNNM